MRKNRKFTAPLALLVATCGPIVAAVVGFAPSAAAMSDLSIPTTSNPTSCREAGGARMCGRQGHTSLHAEPTVRAPQGMFGAAWLPGFGRGNVPPLFAFD